MILGMWQAVQRLPSELARMVRMRLEIGGIGRMALQAHLVRVVEEFQIALILDIGGMKVVAMAAICAALLHALRSAGKTPRQRRSPESARLCNTPARRTHYMGGFDSGHKRCRRNDDN